MKSEEVKMKTGAMHRPYDEAFKRAAVAQWQSGVPARRVAEGLGITTESLRAWRRQLGGADAVASTARASGHPRPGKVWPPCSPLLGADYDNLGGPYYGGQRYSHNFRGGQRGSVRGGGSGGHR